MRKELFYNPRLLLERIAEESLKRRRYVKLKGTAASHLALSQITSLEFLEIAKQNHKIKVIYDIGANRGTWSLMANDIIPDAIIHAFEPLNRFHPLFVKNTQNIKNVHLHKVAAGSENKQQMINFAGDASSFYELGDLLPSMFPSIKKEGEEKVSMIKLDDFIEKNNIPYPDLMKLDVEGYELESLKGGTRCMSHCSYLILEVSFTERHIGQPLFHDILHFLAQHNYYLYAFPVDMHRGMKIHWTDVLFERKVVQ